MTKENKSICPRDHLIAAGKMYPNTWKMVDEFRADRGKNVPNWPAWCFLPLAGFYAIVSADAGVNRLPLALVSDVARLGALGIWRATQGVYRFDPAVYESVRDTPLTGDLPCDVFYRLPEWCVYIETPDVETAWGRQHGAWVHLEWDANTGRTELRVVLDMDATLLPLVLHLGDWPITEALERFSAEAAKQADTDWVKLHPEQISDLKLLAEPLVSLTLYLCSVNAEFGDERPQRPRPKKTKRGWRLFPPDNPRTWDIAVRLGSAIRHYYQSEQTGQLGTHEGPRPHIRRAHWHSFWTGPRDDPDNRRLIVKWMPPIPVNISDSDLPATIKPVD